MKKIFLITCSCILFSTLLLAQSVGINNNSPHISSILDVQSSTKGMLVPRMTSIQRAAIATPAAGLFVYDTDTNSYWYYNGTAWNVLSTGASTNFWTLSGTDIFNNTAGNVGIGTGAPFAYGHGGNNKLMEISNPNTGINIQSHLILSTNGTSGSAGSITWASQNVPGTEKRLGIIGDVYETANAARLVFYTRNETGVLGEKLTLLGNGNVGMGTATPLAKLHIAGNVKIDANNTLEFGAGVAGKEVSAGKIGYQSFGTNNALDIVGAGTLGSNRKITFWNEGGAEFRGSVGIGTGTVNPAYKLSVLGSIRSTEIVVETGWADYVFDDKYKLKSLDEVEKFIAQNKHLPNIPSAAEIEKNGLHLGDTQKRMMEKIEELTLYIIQQQKEIDGLKEKFSNLNKVIK